MASPVFITAATAPVTGVNKPINSSTPDVTQTMGRMRDSDGISWRMAPNPNVIMATPVSKRRSRRPTPGQPSAKFENSRCTISDSQRRRLTTESAGLKPGLSDPPFRGLELNDPALYRRRDGMRPVIDMKF